MQYISKLLSIIGALCFLAAGVSIGFTLAFPAGTSAAPALSIGTPTPPPAPTEEPPLQPSPVPPTATSVPTDTPTQPTPTTTPQPTRPAERKQPTPEPSTPTAELATATPEPWTTDVEILKRTDKTAVLPGDIFAFSLVARNIGNKTAFDVVVSDVVPQQFEVIDLASTKGDIGVQGQTVTAYPRALGAGESATYTITVRVRAGATAGQIANTGRITTTTGDDIPGNNTSTVTVEIRTAQRVVQTLQAPPQLPQTAGGDQVPIVAVLAVIPTLSWLGLFGGMLLMVGGVLSWGLRGWLRRVPDSGTQQKARGGTAPMYCVPPMPIGPPRLGPELPAPRPHAALPPRMLIDRDEALRDAQRSYPKD